MPEFNPAYLQLLKTGELHHRAAEAAMHLVNCDGCGWECHVDRRTDRLGVCRTGLRACVSSYGPHMGEEDPLRGWRGSGTIFFTRCNLRCQFCQNHDISQTSNGKETESNALANIMLELQSLGCHNINLVSPSHVAPQIIAAVEIAAQNGLNLPLVYNTGGYDSLVMLKLLDGIINIYMPDMKYANANIALKYSKIRNYPRVNQAGIREMHRQVGDLQIDEQGIATRGLLVRHLILPYNIAGTSAVVHFLADEISRDTYLNLMDQYHPCFNARLYPRLSRPITPQEYQTAVNLAHEAGLFRLDSKKTIY
jgi:putative pyruvate formate lyase activating enzyme